MAKEKSMTIVMCAKGYPGNYRKNLKIKILIKSNYQKRLYLPRRYKDKKQ